MSIRKFFSKTTAVNKDEAGTDCLLLMTRNNKLFRELMHQKIEIIESSLTVDEKAALLNEVDQKIEKLKKDDKFAGFVVKFGGVLDLVVKGVFITGGVVKLYKSLNKSNNSI